MEQIIAKLLRDFENGKLTRRQLVQSLALAATAASAVSTPVAAAEGRVFKAVSINHVSYQVADYKKSRDFYVGLFGMKVTEDDGKECRLVFGDNILIPRNRTPSPQVDHIAYSIADWDKEKDSVEAELKRRGLEFTGSAKTSFSVKDPDGFHVQFGGPRQ